MRQTIFSLLALFISMFLAMNVQHMSFNAETQVVDNEMETIASGVAFEVLDHIGLQNFDSATADENEVSDPNELTPAAAFGTGQLYMNADDIEDFHEMQTHTISEFGFDFAIDVTVQYVEVNNPEQVSASRTFAKRATVTVSNEHLRSPVRIWRTYSYP